MGRYAEGKNESSKPHLREMKASKKTKMYEDYVESKSLQGNRFAANSAR